MILCKLVHRKCHLEAPELGKRSPVSKLCVTDVLCDWEIDSPPPAKNVCVCAIILGPIVL